MKIQLNCSQYEFNYLNVLLELLALYWGANFFPYLQGYFHYFCDTHLHSRNRIHYNFLHHNTNREWPLHRHKNEIRILVDVRLHCFESNNHQWRNVHLGCRPRMVFLNIRELSHALLGSIQRSFDWSMELQPKPIWLLTLKLWMKPLWGEIWIH